MRETNFTILKAIAIMLVVLSHAGVSGWLFNFVFIFHVPVFFMCAGYFFNTRYLTDERTFVVHRIKGLYLPFLRWSVFFLLVHNLLFYCGILSETYGNAAGGVTHPYTWSQFSQHLWSIVFNMSGYDPFLCGAFWFFRALLIAGICFLVAFKLLRKTGKFPSDALAGWGILVLSLLLLTWKVAGGLNMTGVAQGGYRELMGVAFMAMGFLVRQYDVPSKLTWKVALPALGFLLLATFFFPSSMAWRPTFAQFVSLPLPAFAGFLAFLYLSSLISRKENWLSRSLVYVGDRTLYIFAFHLAAFKAVSAVKVAWYGLPWEAVGGHPVVISPANNALWALLYLAAGVGLPLLCLAGYRRVAKNVTFTNEQLVDWAITGCLCFFRLLYRLGRLLVTFCVKGSKALWQGIKDVVAASSTKDE